MDQRDFWAPHCGAVSLSFDDGTKNQLEKAVPLLDEFGFKGTFYVQPYGDGWRTEYAPWKEVAAAGHEIGNHTVSHFCSKNVDTEGTGLEELSVDDIEKDILAAQERLAQIAPHQERWTFAYPCSCTFVGRGLSRRSYVPVIARHFLAGRTVGEYGFANRPDVADLACVWGLSVERMSGFEMIGLVEELTSRGQWVILVFHEIDGHRLTVGRYELRMLLRYLQRRSGEIWTSPVANVAGKIADHRNR